MKLSKIKEFGVVTFKSTHHAIQGEKKFLDIDKVKIRTIPTPREVSHSCGLALRFKLEDLSMVEEIVENEDIEIDGIYKVTRNDDESFSEKLN